MYSTLFLAVQIAASGYAKAPEFGRLREKQLAVPPHLY
uniref:Uncharacterized protein n=1 Tax=mine drainage metagenome TaxID=410659 RepID=E6QHF8_9ZZZZ